MERVKPKKWDVQQLQENKEIQQNYRRKIEEKIREHKKIRKRGGKLGDGRRK
jgi:hypothetical protein